MKFKYAIVVDAPVPNASVLHDVTKLNEDLHHGWVPVREMPMSGAGASGVSAVLVLLQKEDKPVADLLNRTEAANSFSR